MTFSIVCPLWVKPGYMSHSTPLFYTHSSVFSLMYSMEDMIASLLCREYTVTFAVVDCSVCVETWVASKN